VGLTHANTYVFRRGPIIHWLRFPSPKTLPKGGSSFGARLRDKKYFKGQLPYLPAYNPHPGFTVEKWRKKCGPRITRIKDCASRMHRMSQGGSAI